MPLLAIYVKYPRYDIIVLFKSFSMTVIELSRLVLGTQAAVPAFHYFLYSELHSYSSRHLKLFNTTSFIVSSHPILNLTSFVVFIRQLSTPSAETRARYVAAVRKR